MLVFYPFPCQHFSAFSCLPSVLNFAHSFCVRVMLSMRTYRWLTNSTISVLFTLEFNFFTFVISDKCICHLILGFLFILIFLCFCLLFFPSNNLIFLILLYSSLLVWKYLLIFSTLLVSALDILRHSWVA